MAAIVIADASPLIALARVDGLGSLRALFNEVLVTEAVLREVLTGSFAASEARIERAITAGWLRAVQSQSNTPPLPDLDEGEAASIRLALELGGETLLLIDERAGRAIAQEFGLQVSGTAAVIGLAKKKGRSCGRWCSPMWPVVGANVSRSPAAMACWCAQRSRSCGS